MLEMTEAAAILHGATDAVAGADGRDRPRHLHLRRPGAGRRRSPPPARRNRVVHAVRHPLLRADRVPGEARRARSTCTCQRGRERRRHRVPARDPARPGQPQLRHAGGAAGRHAGQRGAPGARHAGGAGGAAARPRRAGRPVRRAAAAPAARAVAASSRRWRRSIPMRCAAARRWTRCARRARTA